MSFIETIGPDDSDRADEDLRALYARVADPVTGRPDHIMTVHSLHPAGLRAHFGLYSAVMRGTPGFRTVDREMVALVVSATNECRY